MDRECKYCGMPLVSGMTVPIMKSPMYDLKYVFCNDDCHRRWRWGIAIGAVEIDGMEGAKVGYSELAMHTGNAGRFIQRLYAVNGNSYGYAVMKFMEGRSGMLHGCLTIHDPHNISLS